MGLGLTVLFDLYERDWSGEFLSALGISPSWMPPVYEGPQITGHLTPAAAASTALKAGTPVMAGGGDQAARAVGVGAVKPGIIGLTVGTSGVVFAITPSALIEPEGRPVGQWSKEVFITAVRTMKSKGMPWDELRLLADPDLEAIYMFMQTLPAK